MSIDVDKASMDWDMARYEPIMRISHYSPPAVVNFRLSSGRDSAEGTIKSVIRQNEEYPMYTVGFDGNPDHAWEISDYAIAETIQRGNSHLARAYVIFYYRPVNEMAVIRDCFPEMLDENGELLPDYAD